MCSKWKSVLIQRAGERGLAGISIRGHLEGENSMKTMLRIGLVLIGVLAIWVACFARERGQSLTKAPDFPSTCSL